MNQALQQDWDLERRKIEVWKHAEPGMGDAVAAILARLGFRKHPGCSCDARRAWLNKKGFWGVFVEPAIVLLTCGLLPRIEYDNIGGAQRRTNRGGAGRSKPRGCGPTPALAALEE